jgi:hypothetical protein
MNKYGLHERPPYKQSVTYIGSYPVIARCPNREATIFMNPSDFQNLSNEGSIDLQKQSDNLAKQNTKETLTREAIRDETHRIRADPRGELGSRAIQQVGERALRLEDFDEETLEYEGDMDMTLGHHKDISEVQRAHARAAAASGLRQIQQAPEAATAATAASSGLQFAIARQPPGIFIPPNSNI